MKTAQIMGVVCSILLGASVYATEYVEKTFPTGNIKTVVLDHIAGNVEFVAGAPEVISIQSAQRSGSVACVTTADVIGTAYQIITKPVGTVGGQCQMNLKITVPKSMAIDARVAAGTVDLRNLVGKLDLNLGDGAVTGTVDLKAAKIVVASGSITLKWLSPPRKGSLDFQVARGDVVLRFPQGSAVNADIAPAGAAAFTSQVPIDVAAPFKVSGAVGAGNIAIRH